MTPPLIYKTPGLECQHADKGCCPRCRNVHLGRMRSPFKDNVSSIHIGPNGLSTTAQRRLVFNLTNN